MTLEYAQKTVSDYINHNILDDSINNFGLGVRNGIWLYFTVNTIELVDYENDDTVGKQYTFDYNGNYMSATYKL